VTASATLYEGDFWHDPYPAYSALRTDDPVHRIELHGTPAWVLTRYDDVRAALADPRLSKDWRYTLPPEQRATAPGPPVKMMILMDPPEHTRLRKLVSRTFTLRRMEELRPQIRRLADELIDALPQSGEVDLLAEYAFPLPVFVICELLGVPAEDREDFAAWSNTMVDASDHQQAMEAMGKLNGYIVELVAAKRENPDDRLISGLIEVADDGDRLSEDELNAMAMMLLIAGHETTVNLIGNGLLALFTHPEQRKLLLDQPELITSAVDEFLRFDSPVHTTPARFTTEDVEYSGVTIPAGSQVLLSLAAANRDPSRFSDADELQVDRDASRHVAFGHGVHHCLGAQLARIEGQEAIGRFLARRPGTELAVPADELVHRHSNLVRGLTKLPVLIGPEV
jgi:Cytochrome P450